MNQIIEKLNRSTHSAINIRPTKIIQFGEGNFLRAFIDWIVQELNDNADFNGDVKIIQPLSNGLGDMINAQDGLYHVLLKGYDGEEFHSQTQLIDVVKEVINPFTDFSQFLKEAESKDLRFIISNTTEAGISLDTSDQLINGPATSFPGKLLQFLYHRYQTLPDSDLIYILPCELIERNGSKLKEIIQTLSDQWKLGDYFNDWLKEKIIFCNTLVDRIVPGYPKNQAHELWEKIGYQDDLLVEGELFHLWVIEGPESLTKHLPFDKTDLNIILTNDLKKHRERKVRVLNGLHTTMVPIAYLMGLRTVKEAVENEILEDFLQKTLHEEILPNLEGNKEELIAYAQEILRRFKNPAIKHQLISISLNSFSKFKTRVLPSILDLYKREERIADHLLFSLASLITFYKGEWKNENISLNDDSYVLEKMSALWKSDKNMEVIALEILKDEQLWGIDLTNIPKALSKTSEYLKIINKNSIEAGLKMLVK